MHEEIAKVITKRGGYIRASFVITDNMIQEVGKRKATLFSRKHYLCSKCKQQGHSVRTCGKTKEERKVSRNGRKEKQ